MISGPPPSQSYSRLNATSTVRRPITAAASPSGNSLEASKLAPMVRPIVIPKAEPTDEPLPLSRVGQPMAPAAAAVSYPEQKFVPGPVKKAGLFFCQCPWDLIIREIDYLCLLR